MYFEMVFLVSNFLKSLISRNYSNDAKEAEGDVKHCNYIGKYGVPLNLLISVDLFQQFVHNQNKDVP